jgi:hypothetical protein
MKTVTRVATFVVSGVTLAAAIVMTRPALHAQEYADPWIARAPKLSFERTKMPDAPLQIEIPKKEWTLLPAGGSMVLVLANQRGDGVVMIERSTLRLALEPSDINDFFIQTQVDAIKARQPKATEFLSKVLDASQRRLVAVQYTRPGSKGMERVRQYSVPAGRSLYQMICIGPAGRFAAYEPVFAHMASSFTVTE